MSEKKALTPEESAVVKQILHVDRNMDLPEHCTPDNVKVPELMSSVRRIFCWTKFLSCLNEEYRKCFDLSKRNCQSLSETYAFLSDLEVKQVADSLRATFGSAITEYYATEDTEKRAAIGKRVKHPLKPYGVAYMCENAISDSRTVFLERCTDYCVGTILAEMKYDGPIFCTCPNKHTEPEEGSPV